jgi:hypothetical protein
LEISSDLRAKHDLCLGNFGSVGVSISMEIVGYDVLVVTVVREVGGTSMASSKVTVTGPTITSVEPESSTRRAGAHARRKFFEALKVNPKDQSSIRIAEFHCASG